MEGSARGRWREQGGGCGWTLAGTSHIVGKEKEGETERGCLSGRARGRVCMYMCVLWLCASVRARVRAFVCGRTFTCVHAPVFYVQV